MMSHVEIQDLLEAEDIDASEVLPLVGDAELLEEVRSRGLMAAGCHIDSEDIAEAQSLLCRHRRTEALLVIERALPRAFKGAFVPDSPTAYHP